MSGLFNNFLWRGPTCTKFCAKRVWLFLFFIFNLSTQNSLSQQTLKKIYCPGVHKSGRRLDFLTKSHLYRWNKNWQTYFARLFDTKTKLLKFYSYLDIFHSFTTACASIETVREEQSTSGFLPHLKNGFGKIYWELGKIYPQIRNFWHNFHSASYSLFRYKRFAQTFCDTIPWFE